MSALDLLTVNETAALMRVDKQTVYRLIWAGELTWVDISKPGAKKARIRIRPSAIEAWADSREKAGKAA
ncbi:helix-turn-helix domain-containing protein [Micromonospora sp. NPDC005324]|uniref:helix-turn-helix domain-containing protein n=1 Tax=Micromonospora sp. NPDC005324 TaxID=3157033 RepID=UPI0033BC1AE8